MSDLEDRLELLEAQYMTLRESVAKLEKVQYKIREQVGFIEYMAKGPDYPESLETRFDIINDALSIIKHHLGVGDEPAQQPQPQVSPPPQPSQNYTQQPSLQSAYVPSSSVPAPQEPIMISGHQLGSSVPQAPINPVDRVREQVQNKIQTQMSLPRPEGQTAYYQPEEQAPPPAPPQRPEGQESQYSERPERSSDTVRKKMNLSTARRKTVIRISPR